MTTTLYLVPTTGITVEPILFCTKSIDQDLRNKLFVLAQEAPGKKTIYGGKNSLYDDYIWNVNPVWWIEKGATWINKVRDVILEHRHIGHDWQFNSEEKELLQKYYYSNQLLVECLQHGCIVPEKRQEIEKTLLLPYTEIEKCNSKFYNQ